ncbi:MAG: D-2-hydroxyacid dehydrogenase [Candidatus Wallbacteria bacterium]|nr:D-2-hydroxyacid dehydrogenase [Candidatus Wallbacteria bacterium]
MKILICDPIAKDAVEKLKNACFTVDDKGGITKEDLLKVIAEYEVMIVRSATKVTKEVVEAGKNLKVVFRGGVGLDNIDQEACKAKGVEVLNTPGASSISVAELAIGYMFALAREIPQATTLMKQSKWEKKRFKGAELYRKTLGLLGLGRIGSEVAKRAAALGMNVLAYDPYVKKTELPNTKMVTWEELLKNSDYISLHLPLTPETKHFLNRDKFAMMKKGVRIVQCSRGGVIEENDLYEAVKSGLVAGAAMDVFEKEPTENWKLFELDQVIGTPHLGATTVEGQFRVGMEMADVLIAKFAAKQPACG